ncbi:SGNH/GDSL hydrolase family protein [Pontibacter kalidii]|uniref:SGNH/GDSL hydrolase family protein n=1 Tax=Pontibacter kalidii TaxID=2592049 RepID=UPI00225030A5|nr:GDSL-type esterase/lipase family protein [Pontibacter kalidii]
MIQLKYIVLLLLFAAMPETAVSQHVILNKGVPGNNTRDLLKRIEQDVLAERPDLVILMVGTNDMVNSHKLVDYQEYRRNYQNIVEQLRGQGAEIIVLAPPPVDAEYLFERHDRSLYKVDPNTRIETAGEIVKALAAENKVHFIDLNTPFKVAGSPSREEHSLIINEQNLGKRDGIHPTREGYQMMAKIIHTYLQANGLLEDDQKIICFGDSMTYGSYMTGAGTAEGDTYPAVLKTLVLRSE